MKNLINLIRNNRIRQIFSLLFLSLNMMSIEACAQSSENNSDKTLSPYFFVQGDDSQTDQLPLKSTKAEVNIAGIIADVMVTQEY